MVGERIGSVLCLRRSISYLGTGCQSKIRFQSKPPTWTASMAAARPEDRGLALGAWGAAQATAAGLAIALSGFVNDAGGALAVSGAFGEVLADPVTGFTLVYGIEILLLLATIIAIGPLSRRSVNPVELAQPALGGSPRIGLNTGGLR